MKNLAAVRKAVLAYVLPFVGTIGTLLPDGFQPLDFWGALSVSLVTGTAVYWTPNDD